MKKMFTVVLAARFSVNRLGAPALSFEEFKNYRQDTILGTSLLVTMPLGQYDSERLQPDYQR